jgi:hypothetical protein
MMMVVVRGEGRFVHDTPPTCLELFRGLGFPPGKCPLEGKENADLVIFSYL